MTEERIQPPAHRAYVPAGSVNSESGRGKEVNKLIADSSWYRRQTINLRPLGFGAASRRQTDNFEFGIWNLGLNGMVLFTFCLARADQYLIYRIHLTPISNYKNKFNN
jgi:hypothetical protein